MKIAFITGQDGSYLTELLLCDPSKALVKKL